jgi:ABC-type Na+ efflux pump permease subunit
MYGRDRQGHLYRRVGADYSGCGCLIGIIVVIGLLIGAALYGIRGALWLGTHLYSYFHNNNAPGADTAVLTNPDYFYICAGLLAVFGAGAVLATITALFNHRKGAAWTAGVLLFLGVGAFIASVITYNTYMQQYLQ